MYPRPPRVSISFSSFPFFFHPVVVYGHFRANKSTKEFCSSLKKSNHQCYFWTFTIEWFINFLIVLLYFMIALFSINWELCLITRIQRNIENEVTRKTMKYNKRNFYPYFHWKQCFENNKKYILNFPFRRILKAPYSSEHFSTVKIVCSRSVRDFARLPAIFSTNLQFTQSPTGRTRVIVDVESQFFEHVNRKRGYIIVHKRRIDSARSRTA